MPALERPATTRSSITNARKAWFGKEVDGRSQEARRWKDIFRTLTQEHGGDDAPEHVKIMARRAASLEVMMEEMETDQIAGKDIDRVLYTKLFKALDRSLLRLGFGRNFIDGKPDVGEETLEDYVRTLKRQSKRKEHRATRRKRRKNGGGK